MYLCMCTSECICMCIYVCVYIYMYVSIYMYVYVCVYIGVEQQEQEVAGGLSGRIILHRRT